MTFGDLWRNNRDECAERDVDLVLMTTNATRGVSHRFPFLEGQWGPLYVNEKEFSQLFPPKVVEWMKNHAGPKPAMLKPRTVSFDRRPRRPSHSARGAHEPQLSLPAECGAALCTDLQEGREGQATKVLVSDGGITSNFPIHFFDGPLPSRPTFGINLVPARCGRDGEGRSRWRPESGRSQAAAKSDPWQNVWMPTTNSSGIQDVARFNEIKTAACSTFS